MFSGSFIAQALGFVSLYFLGRIYDPEAFGQLEIVLKLSAVFIAIAGLRYEMAIIVEDDRKSSLQITQLSLLFNFCISLVLLVVVVLFKHSIADLLKLNAPYYLLAIPLIVWLSGTVETLVLWFNREKRFKLISGNRVASSTTSVATKIAYPFQVLLKGNGLILGHILGQVIALLQFIFKITKEILRVDITQLKLLARKYVSFPKYSMPAALLNILATSMPVFLIAAFDGEAATGHFGNAYKLTYLPLSMLGLALGQVFFERIARLKGDKAEASSMAHQLITIMFFIALAPVLVMLVWGDVITPLLLGPKWQEAGVYIQITVLFYFSMFLTSTFSVAFEAYNKLRIQLVYNLSFLIASALGLYLTYYLGGGTRQALLVFAIIGIVFRLGVINYFFVLFGKNVVLKTIFAIIIVSVLSLLGFGLKSGFNF